MSDASPRRRPTLVGQHVKGKGRRPELAVRAAADHVVWGRITPQNDPSGTETEDPRHLGPSLVDPRGSFPLQSPASDPL